jgi:hypothetical protein
VNFKRFIFFIFTCSIVTWSCWALLERNLERAKLIKSETSKLQASMIEFVNTGRETHSKTVKVLGALEQQSTTVSFDIKKHKKIEDKLSKFYFWLKLNQLPLKSDISIITASWERVRTKVRFIQIHSQLNLLAKGLIVKGVKRLSDRNIIRSTIRSISNQMKTFISKISRNTVTPRVTLQSKNLLMDLEGLIQKLRIQRKYIMGQASEVLKIKPDLFVNMAIMLLGVGFLFSFFFAIKRKIERVPAVALSNEKESSQEKVLPKKTIETITVNEIVEVSRIEETFSHTKYPVMICSGSYKVLWENTMAKNLSISMQTIKGLVKGLAAGREGLNTVTLKRKYYHFAINEVKGTSTDKRYLVQLIPTEKPIFGHSTIIDKSTLKYIREELIDESGQYFEVNSMMSSLLTKTNFIFQLSATVVDFKPFSEDRICQVDRKQLEKSLRQILTEVHSLIKGNSEIKKIAITLSSFENRFFFNFIIPTFEFTDKSWTEFQGAKPESSETFLRRLNELECSMANLRSRITIRNVDYGLSRAGEISFSIENRDHRGLYRPLQNSSRPHFNA